MNKHLLKFIVVSLFVVVTLCCVGQDARSIFESAIAKETSESWSYTQTFPLDDDLPDMKVYVKANDDGSFISTKVRPALKPEMDKFFETRDVCDGSTSTFYHYTKSRKYGDMCCALRSNTRGYLSSHLCCMESNCEFSMSEDEYQGQRVWKIKKLRLAPTTAIKVRAEEFLISKENGHILAIYCISDDGEYFDSSEERCDFDFSPSFPKDIFEVPPADKIIWKNDDDTMFYEKLAQDMLIIQRIKADLSKPNMFARLRSYISSLSGTQKFQIAMAGVALAAIVAVVIVKKCRRK